jgi:hypothetical protein
MERVKLLIHRTLLTGFSDLSTTFITTVTKNIQRDTGILYRARLTAIMKMPYLSMTTNMKFKDLTSINRMIKNNLLFKILFIFISEPFFDIELETYKK